MHISQLHVEHFRNLSSQLIPFSPGINLITGDNGAGKTSLLEAIYFLGRQRSFRTSKPKDILQQQQHYFRLIAKTTNPNHQIGVERKLEKQQLSFLCRIDRQAEKSPATLAKLLPAIAITAQSFQLIDAGPAVRRAFVDYGVFHCQTTFLKHFNSYQKALKNRNAALKQKMPASVINSFTPQLVTLGETIHQMRNHYFSEFKPLLFKHLSALNFPYEISLRYTPGFQVNEGLANSLSQHFENDYRLSHTRFGPHRADMRFAVEGGHADNRLSRGQQKTLILALHLAQIDLIQAASETVPLLLVDDIAAELDADKRNHILDYLGQLHCQMFFSTTEPQFFDAEIRRQAALISLTNGQVM